MPGDNDDLRRIDRSACFSGTEPEGRVQPVPGLAYEAPSSSGEAKSARIGARLL
jgi:hypothetical protein